MRFSGSGIGGVEVFEKNCANFEAAVRGYLSSIMGPSYIKLEVLLYVSYRSSDVPLDVLVSVSCVVRAVASPASSPCPPSSSPPSSRKYNHSSDVRGVLIPESSLKWAAELS